MRVELIQSDDEPQKVVDLLNKKLEEYSQKGKKVNPYIFKTGWTWTVFLFVD